jgi:hypothetical protein
MFLIKSQNGFKITVNQLCQVCHSQIATICAEVESGDISAIKLITRHFFCEECYKLERTGIL